jgi:presenilin-like A22 family membrane protease
MKHKVSVTLLLLGMFLVTQLIGLYVVNHYVGSDLPLGLHIEEEEQKPNFVSLIFSFVIAFAIIFLLMKYHWKWVMKAWFFFVVVMALSVSLSAIFVDLGLVHASLVALSTAVVLSALKSFRPGVFVHNGTELLIYPGIAAIFVQILNPSTVIILLILISLYDMWAVWRTGVMQKMAKYQMEELNIFGGFLLPTADKKNKEKLKSLKKLYKGKTVPMREREKVKVNLAILGGGDVVFPIIAAGVFLKFVGSMIPAFFVLGGAFVGLLTLFLLTRKERAYPAMPFISVGIFLGLILWYLLRSNF